MDDDVFDEGWECDWDALEDCRYEAARCGAEILIDDEVAALGISLTTAERDDAIEELLGAGVHLRFEEDRGGDSFTPAFDSAMDPRHAIAYAQRWRHSLRSRSTTIVRRAPIRRAGRRTVRRHRRLLRRTARAPGRSEDPHEDPVAGRDSRRSRATGGPS